MLCGSAVEPDPGDNKPVEPGLVGREPVPAAHPLLNQLLRAQPEEDFEALRPHLQSAELVKETVLVEAGAPLTRSCWRE